MTIQLHEDDENKCTIALRFSLKVLDQGVKICFKVKRKNSKLTLCMRTTVDSLLPQIPVDTVHCPHVLLTVARRWAYFLSNPHWDSISFTSVCDFSKRELMERGILCVTVFLKRKTTSV